MRTSTFLFGVLLLAARLAAQPANVDVGAADGSSEVVLARYVSGSTSHLLIGAKTPYPYAGSRYSTDNGASWSGNDTIPGFDTVHRRADGQRSTRPGKRCDVIAARSH